MEYAALRGCSLVDAAGNVISLPRQARRLLAFLVTRPHRSAAIEDCIEALWADDRPATARATVHVLVNRIRTAAGAEVVESDPSGYRLAVDLDVDQFFATVLDAERQRKVDPAHAAAVVEAALAAAVAGAFREFGDEDWLQPTIASFAERRRTAEELWSSLRVEAGTAAEVIDRLDAAAVREPLREIRWEHLMVALYRAGRQSDALAAYDRARRQLRDAVGLEPGPGLRWAHRAVLDHLIPSEPVAGPTRVGGARGDAFFGRTAELAELERLVADGRILTIVGIGGVGKSRLADEFLHRCLLAGRHVQRLAVGLGMSEEELARRMVTTAKPRAAEADLTMVELCLDVSRDLDVVIVDAAERSKPAAAALIVRLHEACPRLQVLVTSRLPLGIATESVVALTGLGTDGISSDAYQLVADRLGGKVDELVDREREVLDGIVRRTAGIPMLLELAAATFDPLTVANESPARSSPAGATVIDATNEAFTLIEPAARDLATALAFLPDGMASSTVERWLDDPLLARRLLRQLRSVRVVVVRAGSLGVRYRVLDPIGDALLAAADPATLEPIRRRAMVVLGSLYQEFRSAEGQPLRMEMVELLDDEHENALYVLDRANDVADAVGALRLAQDLSAYWWHQGAVSTSFDRVQRSLDLGTAPARETCAGLCVLAEVACDLFRVAGMRDRWEHALTLTGGSDLPIRLQAKVMLWSALARGLGGDLDGWAELDRAAEPLTRDDPWMRVHLAQVRAMRRVLDGQPSEAREELRRCARSFAELGDEFAATTALYLSASIGDLVAADDTMADVLAAREHAARSGSDRILARLLFVEASAEFRNAETDLDAAERITRQLERSGFVRQSGLARRNLGLAKLRSEDQMGATDDLVAAATRLLDVDRAAAALSLAALGVLAAGSDRADALVASSRAWRRASLIPESVADAERWEWVESMIDRSVGNAPDASLLSVEQVRADLAAMA